MRGRADTARQALAGLCCKTDGCRVNPRPALATVVASPAVCDPTCPQFAQCNPAYAHLDEPGRRLGEDAHRLAVRVCLALAAQHCVARPPRFVEAAQEWVRGRSLAGVIGEADAYVEEVAGQVLGLLETLREQPEWAAVLLEQALAAVPSSTLRGRLADQLTDRGIALQRRRLGRGPPGPASIAAAQPPLPAPATTFAWLSRGWPSSSPSGKSMPRRRRRPKRCANACDEALKQNLDVETYRPLREWAVEQAGPLRRLASLPRDPLAALADLNDRLSG